MAYQDGDSPAPETAAVEPQADTGADPENTVGHDGDEPRTVPYGRFSEVVAQKNELKKRLEAAMGEEAKGPPPDSTPQQKLDWYLQRGVQKHAPEVVDALLKQEVGVGMTQLKTLLSEMKGEVQHSALRRFEGEARTRGLDPDSKQVRTAVASMVQQAGMSMEQALDALASIRPATDDDSRDMTIPGLTGITAVEDREPRSWEEGVALAKKGRAIRDRRVTELLRSMDSEGAKGA